MENISTTERMVVSHRNYNLAKLDSLHELPVGPAIYGLFAIVDEEPVNCRYIGESQNLQEAIKDLFEGSHGEGLQKFMQGPWIKMVQFNLMPGSTKQEREDAKKIWMQRYAPKIDEKGEYPGYYHN